MSKSNAAENDYLKLLYNAVGIANLADNAVSGPLGSIYVALHTADPGEAGTQATSECAYPGYARVAVVRSASGWTVAANVVTPVADINFPIATGGAETATFFSTGVAGSGATKILHSGPLSPTISISNGVTPQVRNTTSISED